MPGVGRSAWLEQHPQMARRIQRGGPDLGNHNMHHLDIAAMDASGARAEICGVRRLFFYIGRFGSA